VIGRHRARRLPFLMGAPTLMSFCLLTGCATFGSNVRGSFSCAAPDGICAPSSSIDDRALAMIAGESGSVEATPAGPVPNMRSSRHSSTTAATRQILPVPPLDTRRTQERVLRIVFQPYIDERGRLHEASAVHAVVQSGEWQQLAIASVTPIPDRNAAFLRATPESLAEAVDRADPAVGDVAPIDPNLPDPAVVAAARARGADPVAAIKADVAARLAPKAGRNARQGTPATPKPVTSAPKPSPAVPTPLPSASAPSATAGGPVSAANGVTGITAPPRTTVGAESMARVKASPQYEERAAEAQNAARAAAGVGAPAATKTEAKPVVRASGFPAAVPQEN